MFIFSKGFLYTATPVVATATASMYAFGLPKSFSLFTRLRESTERVDIYGEPGVYKDPEFTTYLEAYMRRLLEKQNHMGPRSFRSSVTPSIMIPEFIKGTDKAYIFDKNGSKIQVLVSDLFEVFLKVANQSTCTISSKEGLDPESKIEYMKKHIESKDSCTVV